ncbi:MAG: T9SS type A sorting domain-containing protein [Candidatus Stahlbacteria bacterium]|nr:MAG: T9SS type A sorting domain-containing protein [Candidatus Stahlbacteria bacterium]
MKLLMLILFFLNLNSSPVLDLVRIDVKNPNQVKELDRMGVVINQVYPDHVVAEIEQDMYSLVRSKGYKIVILQENISDVYLRNSMAKSTLGQYLTYEQIRDSMVTLALNYPEICHIETLGYSHQNRLLLAMKISDSADIDETEPALHFEGNIHGNEKIAWAVNFCMLSYLIEHYPSDTLVQRLVDSREIWIAPLVNPDGYISNTRYNARGVDLNRNWGWMWGNEYACGNDFLSENESWKYVEHFWRHPFVTYASYHSGTIYLSEPWSYTTYLQPPEQNLIQHLSQGYASFTGYPHGQGSIGMYPINGCTKDYDYGCGGEIGWSVEVCYIKTPPPESIDVIFDRDRPAMLWLMHKVGQGIHGQITDSLTGEPLHALIIVDTSHWHSYSCPVNGDFHRFYLPGTYDVSVLCPGYDPKTITNVVVPTNTPDSSVYLDIELNPNTNLPIYATRMIGSGYVSTYSNMTYPVWALGTHDGQPYQLDAGKWIVLAFDFPIRNGSGNDLSIYRSSGSGSATVMVSNDWRGSWQTLGTANSAISEFDIASAGFDSVMYVRFQAQSQFMLDAVEAVQIIPGIAEKIPKTVTKNFQLEISPTVLNNSSVLNIYNPKKNPVQLKIFNTLGQKIEDIRIRPGNSRIKMSNFASGVYYITVSEITSSNRFILVK